MPQPEGFPSAVIVTGGKQYRVGPGDRLLVDRLAVEAGSELSLDRVLMVADGDALKVGSQLDGSTVLARVIEHPRGKKIRVLRYKSKKRVRVHRGARADLTLLEILEVAGRRLPEPEKRIEPEKRRRGRLLRRAPSGSAAEAAAPAAGEIDAETQANATPRRPARRRAQAEASSSPAGAETQTTAEHLQTEPTPTEKADGA